MKSITFPPGLPGYPKLFPKGTVITTVIDPKTNLGYFSVTRPEQRRYSPLEVIPSKWVLM